jgi:hypothetical protein
MFGDRPLESLKLKVSSKAAFLKQIDAVHDGDRSLIQATWSDGATRKWRVDVPVRQVKAWTTADGDVDHVAFFLEKKESPDSRAGRRKVALGLLSVAGSQANFATWIFPNPQEGQGFGIYLKTAGGECILELQETAPNKGPRSVSRFQFQGSGLKFQGGSMRLPRPMEPAPRVENQDHNSEADRAAAAPASSPAPRTLTQAEYNSCVNRVILPITTKMGVTRVLWKHMSFEV